jgi:hypothetical protein
VAGAESGGAGGESLAYWQTRLDTAEQQLSSAGGACHDICRAAGEICVAAHEICGMTGDNDTASPMDPRCSRARTACTGAERQRDGSCPVCPRD